MEAGNVGKKGEKGRKKKKKKKRARVRSFRGTPAPRDGTEKEVKAGMLPPDGLSLSPRGAVGVPGKERVKKGGKGKKRGDRKK